MTTIIPTFSEGYRHQTSARSAGWTPMATVNCGSNYATYMGPFNVAAWVKPGATSASDRAFYNPRKAANAVASLWRPLPLNQRILDFGDRFLLRSSLLNLDGSSTGQTTDSILCGLDDGFFRCDHEIALFSEFARILRDEWGMKPYRAYGDVERGAAGTAETAAITAQYRRSKAITDHELDARCKQALITTAQTIFQAFGWNPNGVMIQGCANVSTLNGNSLPITCPINHISGDKWPTETYPLHRIRYEAELTACQATGKPTWVLLDAQMPPAEIAYRYQRAIAHGVESIQQFCDNTVSELTLTSQIQATAEASQPAFPNQ